MTAAPVGFEVDQDAALRGAARWAHANLFNSPASTLLTILIGAVLAWLLYAVGHWLLVLSDWDVVRTNRRLLLVGRLPQGEEWRVWTMVFVFAGLIGASWGAWGRIGGRALAVMALVAALLGPLLVDASSAPVVAAALGLGVACYVGARSVRRSRGGEWALRRGAIVGWVLALPLALLLMHVAGGVESGLWGGFYLNVLVTCAAAMGAVPLGVALALGRTSSYRALRFTCTVYIEVMRGLPLIVILTLSWLALRSFLPEFWGLDNVGLVYRVMIAFALFTGAFVAEALRGGLSAVPRGQQDAAAALGMRPWQVLAFVTLPLGVRNATPALAGEAIGLFMSTALISVVGLTDMLQAARGTTEQPDFFGRQKEVLLIVGAVFWITGFALSRLSGRLERALSGTRRS